VVLAGRGRVRPGTARPSRRPGPGLPCQDLTLDWAGRWSDTPSPACRKVALVLGHARFATGPGSGDTTGPHSGPFWGPGLRRLPGSYSAPTPSGTDGPATHPCPGPLPGRDTGPVPAPEPSKVPSRPAAAAVAASAARSAGSADQGFRCVAWMTRTGGDAASRELQFRRGSATAPLDVAQLH
jgi:hypothetical protein